MIRACHKSLRSADVVGVVHDVSNRYSKDFLHTDVVNMLNIIADTPSFLIINKVSGSTLSSSIYTKQIFNFVQCSEYWMKLNICLVLSDMSTPEVNCHIFNFHVFNCIYRVS